MATPLVSVLIPCFNAAASIEETLQSVLAQTWPALEVIVVDDGSSDGTATVATRVASDRVRVISQANAGQSAAENRAFRESRGEFIEYLDADDLLAPDKIERQMRRLDGDGDAVASGEWARFYATPADAIFEPDGLWQDHAPVDWLIHAWSGHLMMHGAAWLVPRRVVERAGGWDERLSLINDFDFFSRVLLASSRVRFCPGARTFYRSGNLASLSGTKSRRAWESGLLSLQKGTSNLLAAEHSARTRQACARVFQRFAFEVYAQQSDLAAAAQQRADELGGADLVPSGGPMFRALSFVLGWQRASFIRQRVYRLGYERAAIGWRLNRAWKSLRHRAAHATSDRG